MKNQENETVSQKALRQILEVREQIQKDLLCYLEASWWPPHMHDGVCKIVEENFKKILPRGEE